MATKNASLGALDALRTKVRDKSDTDDKKKADSDVSSEKKNNGKKINSKQIDNQVVKTVEDSDPKKSDKVQPDNPSSDSISADSENKSTDNVSVDEAKSDNVVDSIDNSHESTTTSVDLSDKKKVGRRKMANNKKRVQITLTISHSANDRLTEWARDLPKSGARLLSDYIDYHLDDIIDYYNKIL